MREVVANKTIPCAKCGHLFADLQSLRQHSRHSQRCQAKYFRAQQDLETLIKTRMMRSPELVIDEMRKALENIELIAQSFACDVITATDENGVIVRAALRTVENIAHQVLIGA